MTFIHVHSRKIVLGGIGENPNEPRMKQVARNMTSSEGPLVGARYLIHDRDAKYAPSFDQILKATGTAAVKLPPQSPTPECVCGTVCKVNQDRMRGAVCPVCCAERNHQGIANVIPFPDRRLETREGTIVKAEWLGGLRNSYHRRAA